MAQREAHSPVVFWIGADAHCSLRDGLAWHDPTWGETLAEGLDAIARVERSVANDWDLVGDRPRLRGQPLAPELLAACTLLFANHKRMAPDDRRHLAPIEAWFRQRAPAVRIPHPTTAWNLFASKQTFAEHAAALPHAGALVPPFRAVTNRDDLAAAIDALGLPLVLKADDQSGGVGTSLVRSRHQAERVFAGFVRDDYYVGPRGALARQWRKWNVSSSTKRRSAGADLSGPRTVQAMELVDTYHPKLSMHLNAAVYYWGDHVFLATPRPARRRWNIHARDVAVISELGRDRFRAASEQAFETIVAHRQLLDELRASLPAWCIRFDCLVTPDKRLYVVEPEMKWGAGTAVARKMMPALREVGYDLSTLRSTLDLREADALDLIRAAPTSTP